MKWLVSTGASASARGRLVRRLVLAAAALMPLAWANGAVAQDLSKWQTPEYKASGALDQINAAGAYNLGYTGAGITIGVMDTGIDARHPEFAAPGKFLGGYNGTTGATFSVGTNGDTAPAPKTGHGTFVSGIAAASRDGSGMQGVAFDSGLYVGATFDGAASNWKWLTDRGVVAINNSFGINDCTETPPTPKCNIADYSVAEAVANDPDTVAAARKAVNAGVLMVFATGNEAQPHPDFWAGLPYRIPDLKNGWLAVGSVDANNTISDFSNKCGVAAQWCLVAPGEVYSSVIMGRGANGGNYNAERGTSYAAPVVTGVAALVKQAHPWFTAYDLQQTLLTTATDLGDPGIDAVYGWGLVNAEKAVKGYGQFVDTVTLDTKGFSSTFSNNINGAGGLIKTGAGTLTMTGASTYAGTTTINGGALVVDGSITSAVTVAAGGTLGGAGRVGTTVVDGTIGVGAAKTLTINGNLTFNTGATYFVTVRGPAADRLDVTGTATIAGTLKLAAGSADKFNTSYTLVSAAGGLTGTFGTVQSLFGAGVDYSVGYDASTVQLRLAPKSLLTVVETPAPTPPAGGGAGTNAPPPPPVAPDVVALARALDKSVAGGDDVSDYFGLFNLPADQIDEALNQLAGEVHSDVSRVGTQVSRQFLDAMTDPFANGRAAEEFLTFGYGPAPGGAGGQAINRATAADPQPKYRVWAAVTGSTGRTGADASTGAAATTANSGGIVGGVDFRLAPNVIGGLAIGGGRANASVSGGLGSLHADVLQLGGFITAQADALTVAATGAYSNLGIRTNRSIPVLGITDLSARYNADVWAGRVEARYEVAKIAGLGVSPFASFLAQDVVTPAFTEKDASGAAAGVSVQRSQNWTTQSVLGLDLRGATTLGTTRLTGFARLGWGHYFSQGATMNASLVDLAGSDFSITGARSSRDGVLVSTGFEVGLTPASTLSLRFDTEQAKNAQIYAGSARVKVAF